MTGPTPDKPSGADTESGKANPDLAAEAAPEDRVPNENLEERQEKLLDEAIQETFPASDPISPKRIS